jgi:hypothetical protein
MIRHCVNLIVADASSESFYDFMLNPSDDSYSQWWPEEHLQFHTVKNGNIHHIGDEVYYDEYIGQKRRLAFRAVVIVANRPNRIVWQMKKAGIRLPAYLELELSDSPSGLRIKHELKIGYCSGPLKVLDIITACYFNKAFYAALEKHCRTEWPKLADYLKQRV